MGWSDIVCAGHGLDWAMGLASLGMGKPLVGLAMSWAKHGLGLAWAGLVMA
jgi:hypothetical protein